MQVPDAADVDVRAVGGLVHLDQRLQQLQGPADRAICQQDLGYAREWEVEL